MPRKNFPAKVRETIFKRAAGHCEKCKAALKKSEGEIDHILPDALTGKPEAANGMLLCRVCHRAKTNKDIKKISKANRQKKKDNGTLKPKGQIKSRGFAKSPKPKKIDKAAIDALANIKPKQLYG